jgi:hypothetical protein
MRSWWLLLWLAVIAACGGPATAPSQSVLLNTIEYQRVYAVSGSDNGQRMLINVSLPEHKTIPFCLPVQQTATSFVCSGLNWELSPGEEAVIFVNDPALNRVVATNVFVNSTRISRIETLSNGNELGRFHMTSSGRIE